MRERRSPRPQRSLRNLTVAGDQVGRQDAAGPEQLALLIEHVVIVTMVSENVPYVPADEQLRIDDLGYRDDGILHVTVRHGFPHPPGPSRRAALRRPAALPVPELRFDPDQASYFLSRITPQLTPAPGMRQWRKRLFLALARNAADPAEYFRLPDNRTVTTGSQVDI